MTNSTRALPTLLLFLASAVAQNVTSTLSGTVSDPSGAVIRNVTVVLQPHAAEANPVTITTDSAGHFSIALSQGIYDLSIEAPGFAPYTKTITLTAAPLRLDPHLTVAANSEKVEVTPDSDTTDSGNNKSALVFKREQLDTLSNNDTTFQQEILAIAGGSGEDGAQIYVDGFSNGKFPPKDTIREIRINQNPYSAEYDSLGYGRVEISTKPGSDKLHGNFYSSGNDNVFNAQNPFTGAEPPYYSVFAGGDVGGPLGKNTSLFGSGRYENNQSNAIVDAFNPDGSKLLQAVPNPNTDDEFTLRVDRQLTKNNTLVSRYEFDHNAQKNGGVGLLVLPSEGFTSGTTTQTLQLGNTFLIGTKIVSESRFQYVRTRTSQTPNSTAPTLVVQGFFNAGGSASGTFNDKLDNYEFQQYFSASFGKHFLRAGGRSRIGREANRSTANYNGQFTFPDLASFSARTPSQYSVTAGQPSAALLTSDLGVYAEDEWKLRKDITVNYGLRLESQTAIPDHFDPAPRVGFGWAIGQRDKHPPIVTFRAGAGLFYQRFASGNILTSIRQNGISQQSFFVSDPALLTGYPNPPSTAQLTGTPPTPYTISPRLHAATNLVGTISLERALGTLGNITVSYEASRGTHNYNSFNINAPLPGTFVFNDPTQPGVRPLGGNGNIYQFASEGVSKGHRLSANGNLNVHKKLFLWFYYSLRTENSDTAGAGSFPTQPYSLSADFGPSGLGNRSVNQRLYTGGDYTLPFGFSANLFLSSQSGPRYNITTGTDLNGDTIYNDRPAFASNPGSTFISKFDPNPKPGETIIPFNYGHAPGLFFSELGLSREFKFGPRPAAEPLPPGTPAPKGPVEKPDPRYDLSFSADASNILNHVNPGPPVGVLTSPDFGHSISINSGFSNSAAANRTVSLQTNFRF